MGAKLLFPREHWGIKEGCNTFWCEDKIKEEGKGKEKGERENTEKGG